MFHDEKDSSCRSDKFEHPLSHVAPERTLCVRVHAKRQEGEDRTAAGSTGFCGNARSVCADWSSPFWKQKVKPDQVEVSFLILEICGGTVSQKAQNGSALVGQVRPPLALRCTSTTSHRAGCRACNGQPTFRHFCHLSFSFSCSDVSDCHSPFLFCVYSTLF